MKEKENLNKYKKRIKLSSSLIKGKQNAFRLILYFSIRNEKCGFVCVIYCFHILMLLF